MLRQWVEDEQNESGKLDAERLTFERCDLEALAGLVVLAAIFTRPDFGTLDAAIDVAHEAGRKFAAPWQDGTGE